jgi:hypothetical protein
MNETFYHKGFFKSKYIQIHQTGVEVKKKSFFNYDEYQIDFDQFTTKKTVKREINHGILFFVATFSLVTLFNFISTIGSSTKGYGAPVIFLIITLIFFSVALLTKKQIVTLTTSYDQNGLELPFNKDNEQEVRAFADKIIEKTKEFLISKYARVDKDLPRDSQLENIISLKDRSIITEQEFERLKNILVDKETDKRIGF